VLATIANLEEFSQ